MAITRVTCCTITICFGCFLLSTLFLFNVTGITSLHLDLALRHCQLMRTCWSKNCQTLCHCHGRVLAIGGLSPLLLSLGTAPLSAEPPTHDSGLYLTTKNVHVVKLSKRRAFSLVSSFFWCRRSRHPHRTSVSVCEELPSPNRNVSRLHRSMV